ncbi:MAG: hypothetical protein AAGA09_08390 [Pseudomonadota bacterium]
MKKPIAAIFVSTVLFAAPGAMANEAVVLGVGDRIELAQGDALSVYELRDELRALGYSGFTQGDHTGQIIKITAFGPDRKRYRLKVHMYSGEVRGARHLKHLF